MSKGRMSGIDRGNNAPASALAQHELSREQKRQIWAEMMKRKEEPQQELKMSTLDKWYKDQSNQTAKALTAVYLAAHYKSPSKTNIQKNYGISPATFYKYQSWLRTGRSDTKINEILENNKKQFVKDARNSVPPTIEEIKRLYNVANELHFSPHHGRVVPYVKEADRAKKPNKRDRNNGQILTKEEKDQLLDIANLELNEIKTVTKSDVVVAVIVGAVVGAYECRMKTPSVMQLDQ